VLRDDVAMHRIFFDLKRGFLSSVWITRKWLREIHPAMTAARYDMMYAIHGLPTEEGQFVKRSDGIWDPDN
jgi:hypothetical protein